MSHDFLSFLFQRIISHGKGNSLELIIPSRFARFIPHRAILRISYL